MSEQTVRVLEEALELIRDEQNWCQGAFRKPALNQRCALAAVTDALGQLGIYEELGEEAADKVHADATRALMRSSTALYGMLPSYVNDKMGHAEVVVMYKDALAGAVTEEDTP